MHQGSPGDSARKDSFKLGFVSPTDGSSLCDALNQCVLWMSWQHLLCFQTVLGGCGSPGEVGVVGALDRPALSEQIFLFLGPDLVPRCSGFDL